MPELPEVEVIARALSEGGRGAAPITGKTIRSVMVLWPRTVEHPTLPDLTDRLTNCQIHAVNRRGKYIVISLSGGTLLIHLRMSGDLRVEQQFDEQGNLNPLRKHDRVSFVLTEGLRLVFEDARKFGRIWFVDDPTEVTGELGPEPLDPSFEADRLYEMLSRRRRQLKPLLMDQKFIAGLGNIYTDEILFEAGLHPLRSSEQIGVAQTGALLNAIRKVLRTAIEQNGSSIDWAYRGGEFQNTFNVYQRVGEPCPRCGTQIEKIIVGQRGTHFCPNCQPL